MPPVAVRTSAQLIVDRAGEAAAPVAEQLAVGQLARGRGAVVGQKHRRAAQRADVNGARDELLAGAAFAGDQHGQLVALQSLNLLDHAHHGGAGAQESRQQRLERLFVARSRPGPRAAGAPRRDRTPARRWRRSCAGGAGSGSAIGRGERIATYRGPSTSRPVGSEITHPVPCERPTARIAMARARSTSPPVQATSRRSPSGGATNTTAHSASSVSRMAAAVSWPSSSGNAAASTSRRTMASSASMEEQRIGGLGRRQPRRGLLRFDEIARRAERFEHRGGQRELMLGLRARARAARRGGRARDGSARPDSPRRSARTRSRSARCRGTPPTGDRPIRAAFRGAEEILPTRPAWRARRCAWPGCRVASRRLGAPACEQRFARDELGLNRFRRRRLGAQFRSPARSASSVAPRRAASFASSTRIDHSYHWLVCAP